VTWTNALRMQHLREDIKRPIQDLQIFNTSLRHKTRRAQAKKIEDQEDGLLVGAPDQVHIEHVVGHLSQVVHQNSLEVHRTSTQ
jgi:hypothetical protein